MTTTHRTPPPGSDEDFVREVLDSAMSGSHPPLGLTATALARGRRLRTRRRAGIAATAVAAAVVAGLALPSALGGDGGGAPDSSDLVATEPPAPEPALPPAPTGYWDMQSRHMVMHLSDRLPEGRVVSDSGPLDADTPEGGLGRGFINSTLAFSSAGDIVEGNVNLMMWPHRSTALADAQGDDGDTVTLGLQDDHLACPENQQSVLTCLELTDAAGATIARRMTSLLGEVRVLEFTLVAGDGIVYGATANTVDDKWGEDSEVTAPRPPLDLAELEELVRDPVWTTYRP